MAAAPRQLYNSPTDVVGEMLEGVVLCNPALRRLEGYNVVVRSEIDRSKVALISGGGSGHEPSHAGWVAPGMLTGAVAGSVFASPSTASVLAAIMHVTGSGGCLVIVKNYTGDRLNFGLACEQAKAAGLDVQLVVVGDDCAIPDRGIGIAGRRGVAGTVFVHKLAGSLADAGASLAEVAAMAQTTASSVGSMGVALRSCVLPGQAREERIADGMMEVGLGIHGEPGAMVMELKPVDLIVDLLLEYITSTAPGRSYLTLAPGEPVALLVNNLGSSTQIELSIATRRAVATLEAPPYSVKVERVYVGPFMTALDMAGVSLSVLKLTHERLAALDTPCAAWPASGAVNRSPTVAAPDLPSGAGTGKPEAIKPPAGAVLLSAEQSAAVGGAIKAAAEAVQAAEGSLTAWDEICGDGDCGTTLSAGAATLLAELPSYSLEHPASVARAVGGSLERSMGGSSGALYSIFLNAAANTLAAAPPTPAAFAAAFAAGGAAMSKYGGASVGHRTMLDAMVPAAEAGADATKEMAAGAGRASYVPQATLKEAPDPGAKAVSFWLGAASASLS